MSTLEVYYIRGFYCNARNCEATIEGEELDRYGIGPDVYKKRAKALGWSCWSSRSVYHYCPQHGPGKKHVMRQWW